MRLTRKLGKALAAALLTGAVLLLTGLAPAQAAGAELRIVATFSQPDSNRLEFVLLFAGEIADDGFFTGTAKYISGGPSQTLTYVGSVGDDNLLKLDHPLEPIRFFAWPVIDLESGYAEFGTVNGTVFYIGVAHVILLD